MTKPEGPAMIRARERREDEALELQRQHVQRLRGDLVAKRMEMSDEAFAENLLHLIDQAADWGIRKEHLRAQA